MEKTKTKRRSRTKLHDDSAEDMNAAENECTTEQPQQKIARMQEYTNVNGYNLALNKKYQSKDFIKWIGNAWNAKQKPNAVDVDTDTKVYKKPYQIGILPELLESADACQALVDEMVNKVHWSRKQMDLYEFYQSTDLSNMVESHLLTNFLHFLRRQVRPWLEQVTGIKLDYVSASCSMYTCGDYLLVHDDLLKDRQIAFIYYLSPWKGTEEWREDYGGCLEIFNSDEQGFPQFPVHRKISPKNNQFAFFKVGARSFHQVGEVTNYDYPRMTINGWFHGATNEELMADSLQTVTRLDFNPPNLIKKPLLPILLNQLYLKPATKQSIQKRIEDNSEICLYEFFRSEVFEKALKQLLEDKTLVWRRCGPANAHNYEVLELNSANTTIGQLLSLFGSNEMFELLRDYTDLDLFGVDALMPTCSVELQRWTHGNYTVLGDGAICEENTLDLIYYLNASEGAAVITYLSPETEEQPKHKTDSGDATDVSNEDDDDGNNESEDDESVLLTITPIDNALNVVYRCEGTMKFTKYVSHNTPLNKGPVFVLSCSYKE